MKLTDIGGFAAILGAGYLIGRDQANVSWDGADILLIVGLLAVGWYLAVTLS
jgi:hypothetical protein